LALPGETGEMVDTGDVEGLTQAVLSVMRDPQHARQLGAAARARVSDLFSLSREAEGIGRVYSALFDRANH
jgi:mannosyltransferase